MGLGIKRQKIASNDLSFEIQEVEETQTVLLDKTIDDRATFGQKTPNRKSFKQSQNDL